MFSALSRPIIKTWGWGLVIVTDTDTKLSTPCWFYQTCPCIVGIVQNDQSYSV